MNFSPLILNVDDDTSKDFYFQKGLSVNNFKEISHLRNCEMLIHTTNLINNLESKPIEMNNAVGHLSTNYEYSNECSHPKKVFYHFNIMMLPQLNFKQIFSNENQDLLNCSHQINFDNIHYNDSTEMSESIDDIKLFDYYSTLQPFIENILQTSQIKDKEMHKITTFLFDKTLEIGPNGTSYNFFIQEVSDKFNNINKHQIKQLCRLLISCGLLFTVPLDIELIINGTFAHEWNILIPNEDMKKTFISRPWIDHKTGDICPKMVHYICNLFEILIRENPGITKVFLFCFNFYFSRLNLLLN